MNGNLIPLHSAGTEAGLIYQFAYERTVSSSLVHPNTPSAIYPGIPFTSTKQGRQFAEYGQQFLREGKIRCAKSAGEVLQTNGSGKVDRVCFSGTKTGTGNERPQSGG